MFVCTTFLYKSHRNDINILFDNTHVRIIIYWEFYHAIHIQPMKEFEDIKGAIMLYFLLVHRGPLHLMCMLLNLHIVHCIRQ